MKNHQEQTSPYYFQEMVMNKVKTIFLSPDFLLSVFNGAINSAKSETIIVGSQAGIVWEGLNWSANGTSSHYYSSVGGRDMLYSSWALAILSTNIYDCLSSDYNTVHTINGVTGVPITDHMILVPIANGATTYTDYNKKTQTITWRSNTDDYYWNMPFDNNKEYSSPNNGDWWCAAAFPGNSIDNNKAKVLKLADNVTYTGQGHWVIYADGKQTTTTVSISPMYFYGIRGNDGSKQILPANFNVRVTSLKCTVNTPQTIDFGSVANNSKTPRSVAGEVSVACVQGSVPETLDVSLLARPVGGSLLPTETTIGLQIDGESVGSIRGFIGERANDEAGCSDKPSSLSLNYLNQYQLGNISINESAKNFTQPLVWTFCPNPNTKTGRATAAIELSATFK